MMVLCEGLLKKGQNGQNLLFWPYRIAPFPETKGRILYRTVSASVHPSVSPSAAGAGDDRPIAWRSAAARGRKDAAAVLPSTHSSPHFPSLLRFRQGRVPLT